MIRVVIVFMLLTISNCTYSEKISISLYDSSAEIKKRMLSYTPAGGTSIFVEKFIDKDLFYKKITSSPYALTTGVRVREVDDSQIFTIVGEHSIKLLLGTYRDPKWLFLFQVDVYVRWAFSEENELIDVFVHKYNRPS
ncbi:MAG: hypothetical protein GY820_12770 [Gammaproteobacteria bacterium]|nr:hypothetical protein [Gammaproteobacteria bacterium]